MKKYILLIIFILLLTGCSSYASSNQEELQINSPLKMKEEYSKILNDKVIEEMVGESYNILATGYNNRDKENGSIKPDDSINQYIEFIQAATEKAIENHEMEKADMLIDFLDSSANIVKVTNYTEPELNVDTKGDYVVDSETSISEENFTKIKDELTFKIDKYFE
ncbi:lipoprotein [Paenibacillus medicaginis]|uniref:Lipoprotein n=1 Tax=Paenibacillus medicaginis TaxID=1470560 RepID=A0ABV5BV37_9BACL